MALTAGSYIVTEELPSAASVDTAVLEHSDRDFPEVLNNQAAAAEAVRRTAASPYVPGFCITEPAPRPVTRCISTVIDRRIVQAVALWNSVHGTAAVRRNLVDLIVGASLRLTTMPEIVVGRVSGRYDREQAELHPVPLDGQSPERPEPEVRFPLRMHSWTGRLAVQRMEYRRRTGCGWFQKGSDVRSGRRWQTSVLHAVRQWSEHV